MYLTISVDSNLNEVYVDGVSYAFGTAANWPGSKSLPIPADFQVIAIKATKQGGVRYDSGTLYDDITYYDTECDIICQKHEMTVVVIVHVWHTGVIIL